MDRYLKRDKARRPLRLLYYLLLMVTSSGVFFSVSGSLAKVSVVALALVFVLLGVGAFFGFLGTLRDSWRGEMIGTPLLGAAFADLTGLVATSFFLHPTAGLFVASCFYAALTINATIRYTEVRELRRLARHHAETRP